MEKGDYSLLLPNTHTAPATVASCKRQAVQTVYCFLYSYLFAFLLHTWWLLLANLSRVFRAGGTVGWSSRCFLCCLVLFFKRVFLGLFFKVLLFIHPYPSSFNKILQSLVLCFFSKKKMAFTFSCSSFLFVVVFIDRLVSLLTRIHSSVDVICHNFNIDRFVCCLFV